MSINTVQFNKHRAFQYRHYIAINTVYFKTHCTFQDTRYISRHTVHFKRHGMLQYKPTAINTVHFKRHGMFHRSHEHQIKIDLIETMWLHLEWISQAENKYNCGLLLAGHWVECGLLLAGHWVECGLLLAGHWVECGLLLAGHWVECGLLLDGHWILTEIPREEPFPVPLPLQQTWHAFTLDRTRNQFQTTSISKCFIPLLSDRQRVEIFVRN